MNNNFDNLENKYNNNIYTELLEIEKNNKNSNIVESEYINKINEKNITWGYHNLALYYNKNNDLDKALKYFKLSVKAGNLYSLYNLGEIYKNKNNIIEAEKYFLFSIFKINDNWSMHQYAEILHKKEILLKYTNLFDNLNIKKQNNNISDKEICILNLLTKYIELIKSNKNTEGFEKLINIEYNNNLISHKIINKDIEKYYLMAIELGNSWSMNNWAEICKLNNDFSNAEKYYKMAITIDKNNSWALYNYATFLIYYNKKIKNNKNNNIINNYLIDSINLNNKNAMLEYYLFCSKNKIKSKYNTDKLLINSVNLGNNFAIIYLVNYIYFNINSIRNDYSHFNNNIFLKIIQSLTKNTYSPYEISSIIFRNLIDINYINYCFSYYLNDCKLNTFNKMYSNIVLNNGILNGSLFCLNEYKKINNLVKI